MNRRINDLKNKKSNLKSKYDRERKSLDDQIQLQKDADKRDRERKKQEKEQNKNIPPPPLKQDPQNDPAYNTFIKDTLSIKELNEHLKKYLRP